MKGASGVVSGLVLIAATAAAAPSDEETGGARARPPEGTTVPAVRDPRTVEREVRELQADINVLNLVNGLHLTPHQVLHLLRAAREARAVLDDATAPPRDEKAAEREVGALERIRAALLAGEPAPEEALRDLDNLRTRDRGPRRGGAEISARLREIEKTAQVVLLPSQLEVIRTYKPCLVPPRDLRDPVRVGQAGDAGPMIRLLERVVSIPAARWEREGPALVDRVVEEEQEHLGRYGELEESERRSALLTAFAEARAMDEATFRMRKDLLAERIQPEDRVHAVHLELQEIGECLGEPGKVARILLGPRAIPILERRLEALRTAARTPVDLEAVREADRCQDGHCAVRREKQED